MGKNTLKTVDINKIIARARKKFPKDKAFALQIKSGAELVRDYKDSEYILWVNSYWRALTGLKGLIFGRIIQIAGKPDSGKTTHAMVYMKQAQNQNVYVIFWDVENKFSAVRFEKYFGGSAKDIIMVTSKMILEGGDQVLTSIDSIMEEDPNAKILVVWDSVGGSISKGEGDKDLRQSKQMAESAKENGQVLRGFIRKMEQYKNRETNEECIAILLINQVYANIGSKGNKESGGNKVEFFSSLILQLSRKSDALIQRKGIKRKIGIISRAKIRKNHLFDGEDTVAEFDLLITAGKITLAPTSAALVKKANEWPGWSLEEVTDVIEGEGSGGWEDGEYIEDENQNEDD